MPQTTDEKKARFSRIFPNRVEACVDQFRKIANCSAAKDYEYDRDTVAMVWVHLLLAMRASAKSFGLELSFTINGKSLDDLRATREISDVWEARTHADVELPLF